MKLWKKAAAAVLAAVMSLTLLTGCSGGGTGAAYTRDTEKEKLATQWTQKYVKELAESYGKTDYTLTVDETAVSASEAAMPYFLQQEDYRSKHPANMGDWTEAEKSEYSQLLSSELNSAIKKLTNKNKKGLPAGFKVPVNEFSDKSIKAALDARKDNFIKMLGQVGVGAQDVKTLGVVATVRDGVVYMEITFAT